MELTMQYRVASILKYQSGFGSSVLSQLIKTKIKRNLYYEIKDRVFEERSNGTAINKITKKVKVYGFDETKQSRELLMGILRDRMDNHKAKFISPILYDELCTLEVKKNGKIEHSTNAHDDQIFSYLMALYVWYEGKDLMERYGLQKGTIQSDDDSTVEFGIGENLEDISADMITETNEVLEESKQFFDTAKSMSYKQWREKQMLEDMKADEMLRNDPRTRDAWYKHNHLHDDQVPSGLYTIPNDVFDSFYTGEEHISPLQQEFNQITNIR